MIDSANLSYEIQHNKRYMCCLKTKAIYVVFLLLRLQLFEAIEKVNPNQFRCSWNYSRRSISEILGAQWHLAKPVGVHVFRNDQKVSEAVM